MSDDAAGTPTEKPLFAPGYLAGPARAAQPPNPTAVTRSRRPRPVDLAVLLMRVASMTPLLGILALYLERDLMYGVMNEAVLGSDRSDASEIVGGAWAWLLVWVLVLTVAEAVLWLWMAHANGSGRAWARVFSTVLFVLLIVEAAPVVFSDPGAVVTIRYALEVALGATVVVLLWRPESSRFFAARSARAA